MTTSKAAITFPHLPVQLKIYVQHRSQREPVEAPTTVLLHSYMFNGAEKGSPRMPQCPAAVPSATTREPQWKSASCAAKPRIGQPFMVLNISGTNRVKNPSLHINNLRLSPRGCNQFKHIRGKERRSGDKW